MFFSVKELILPNMEFRKELVNFHEMDERSKDVPRDEVERNEEQWKHDPKEK